MYKQPALHLLERSGKFSFGNGNIFVHIFNQLNLGLLSGSFFLGVEGGMQGLQNKLNLQTYFNQVEFKRKACPSHIFEAFFYLGKKI